MKYTDEMTAACLGISVEEYRAKYKGEAGREQNRLAVGAVKAALAGDSKNAKALIAKRRKVLGAQ